MTPSARLLSTLSVALLFLLVSACDSSGGAESDTEFENSFTLTIASVSPDGNASLAKATERDIEGFSFFIDTANFDEVSEQAFAVYLTDSESFSETEATQGLFGFVARESTRPGPGTYALTDGEEGVQSADFIGMLYENLGADAQTAPFYVLRSGALTLDESTSDRVSGTLEATATSFVLDGSTLTEEDVSITGSFAARSAGAFVELMSPAP